MDAWHSDTKKSCITIFQELDLRELFKMGKIEVEPLETNLVIEVVKLICSSIEANFSPIIS